jgi:hypothetical protein
MSEVVIVLRPTKTHLASTSYKEAWEQIGIEFYNFLTLVYGIKYTRLKTSIS